MAIAYAARRHIMRALGGFLVIADSERACDAIVLLNGNLSTRTYRAAELYAKHPAPVLLCRLADTEEVRLGVLPNISDATRDLLIRRGVAPSDIQVLSSDRWVAGTWAEALLACACMRSRGWRSAAIVTDAFHTRRARWAFRQAMGDDSVEFICVPSRFSMDLKPCWWRSQYGFVQVFTEYLKFLFYLKVHRKPGRGSRDVESELPPAEETRRYVTGQSAGGPGNNRGKSIGGSTKRGDA